MRKRGSLGAGFKARVALEAVKCERTVSALGGRTWPAADYDPPVEEGAADIFERVAKTPADVDQDTVRSLHPNVGKLAVANDHLSRKLEPETGRCGAS